MMYDLSMKQLECVINGSNQDLWLLEMVVMRLRPSSASLGNGRLFSALLHFYRTRGGKWAQQRPFRPRQNRKSMAGSGRVVRSTA